MVKKRRPIRKGAVHVRARTRTLETVKGLHIAYWKFTSNLLYVYDQGYWRDWGYDSFREYCEKELNYGYGKALYLIRTATVGYDARLTNKDRGLVPWTKMREILPVLTKENKDEWISKARSREITVMDLRRLVRIEMKKETLSRRRRWAVRSSEDGPEVTLRETRKVIEEQREQIERLTETVRNYKRYK
ncbi:MAG: hypothetical protein JRH07_08910, partial [Deltaproteobacteria bacterium]|nr:hypothetical protein [Deltaproteobacteria bacterium]